MRATVTFSEHLEGIATDQEQAEQELDKLRHAYIDMLGYAQRVQYHLLMAKFERPAAVASHWLLAMLVVDRTTERHDSLQVTV